MSVRSVSGSPSNRGRRDGSEKRARRNGGASTYFNGLPVRLLLTALLAVAMLGLSVASANAVTLPASFLIVPDSGGANDEVSQSDLTLMGRDSTDPNVFKLLWSWDSTDDWTGTGQTGDACALFDTDGDGNVNRAVCVRINNPGANPLLVNQVVGSQDGNSPFSWSCGDTKPDRCAQPTAAPYTASDLQAGVVNTLAPSPPGNLITDTDPFANLNADQNWPNDSTIQISILKSYVGATATLVERLLVPIGGQRRQQRSEGLHHPARQRSAEDRQGRGHRHDDRVPVHRQPRDRSASRSPGTGETTPFGMPIGTNISVAETANTDWDLTAASCKLEDGTTVTGTKSGNTVSGITIQSGKLTTCTFTNVKKIFKLTLTKTPTPTTYSAVGQTISYSYVVKNEGNQRLADSGDDQPTTSRR